MRLITLLKDRMRGMIGAVPALTLGEEIEFAVAADALRTPVGTGEWDVIVASKSHPRGREILRGVTEEEAQAEVKRWWDAWGGGEHEYVYDDYSRASFYRRGNFDGVICTWGPEAKAMRAAYLKSLGGKPEPPACGFDIW